MLSIKKSIYVNRATLLLFIYLKKNVIRWLKSPQEVVAKYLQNSIGFLFFLTNVGDPTF